jgi:hypothetical protein
MNGNGAKATTAEELKRTLSQNSIETAFNQSDVVSAIRYLVEPGDTMHGLLMRANIPAKQTDDKVFSIAAVHHLSKAEEFGDTGAQNELMNLIALMVSLRGKGREQLVEAIIGEHKQKADLGFGEKLRKMAGLGDEEKK